MIDRRRKGSVMFSGRLTRFSAIAATAVVLAGGAYGIVSATAGSNGSSTTTTAASPAPPSGRPAFGGGGSNARSGPATGGTSGKIASVWGSGLTLSTSAGQKVTVSKASSTTYRKGTSAISASVITKGKSVLVLGTVNGTTIAASQVIVQSGSTSSATNVVPFQRGAPSTSKQVGQIPTNYTQGSGTIVSGTTANKATTAALAAYPGGVVDRVVKLSNGEYEVHNIGVNWPHHIFVSQNFKVVGAN
jgi:membrane-bound inhibitor of C-type lysozyme